jgi:diguanylate cyclase (GGDEF)-like protein
MSAELKKYKTIFDNSPIAILELDYSPLSKLARQLKSQTVTNIRQYLTEHINLVKKTFREIRIIEANEAALELYRVHSKNKLLESLIESFTTSGADILVEHFIALLQGDRSFSGEFKGRFPNPKVQDIFIKIAVQDKSGDIRRVIVTLLDITIWKRIERQLRKRAQLDSLTRLFNHNTIMQRLEEELIRTKRYGLSLSVMMIDLDHFKLINDKFGHPRGDQVLKQVAWMIKNCVRKHDIVGRYGGDEFIIVMPETKPRMARFAAIRIQNMFNNKLFKYQRLISFHVALSIGITGYPAKRVKEAKDLIALADKAMYEAKKLGRNRISII